MTRSTLFARPGQGFLARFGDIIIFTDADEDVWHRLRQKLSLWQRSIEELLDDLRNETQASSSVLIIKVADPVEILLAGDIEYRAIFATSSPIVVESSAEWKHVKFHETPRLIEVSLKSEEFDPVDLNNSLFEGSMRAGGFDLFCPGVGRIVPSETKIPESDTHGDDSGKGSVPETDSKSSEDQTSDSTESSSEPDNILAGEWDDDLELDPLPTETDVEPSSGGAPMVYGVTCSIGHVNRNDAQYCSSCGRRLQGTVTLRRGLRPPLGTLIFDDGSTYGLDQDYVIGRDPFGDDRVVRGIAKPITIDGIGRSVSRVHAEIILRDWDTIIVDKGSANGTFIKTSPESRWNRLVPEQEVLLSQGWRVSIGTREFVFHMR